MHDSNKEVDDGEASEDGGDDVETEELQTLQLHLVLSFDHRILVFLSERLAKIRDINMTL